MQLHNKWYAVATQKTASTSITDLESAVQDCVALRYVLQNAALEAATTDDDHACRVISSLIYLPVLGPYAACLLHADSAAICGQEAAIPESTLQSGRVRCSSDACLIAANDGDYTSQALYSMSEVSLLGCWLHAQPKGSRKPSCARSTWLANRANPGPKRLRLTRRPQHL